MNLEYRRLRAVVCVAEELSFSRAAERMCITQPALSSQIHNLENDLGFALFDRSTRRVALTDKGKRFLAEARCVIDGHERLERFARILQREDSSRVVIGTAFYTIDIPARRKLLETMVENCPHITVEVSTTITQVEILKQLAMGQLDMAVLLGVPVSPEAYTRALNEQEGGEILYPESLRTHLLERRKVELLVPAESPLAKKKAILRQDLRGQEVAIIHAFHGEAIYRPIYEFVEQAGAKPVVPPEPHAVGVERFGRQFGIPAITLGWFPGAGDARMVSKPVPELDAHTQLVIAACPEYTTAAIEHAFGFSRELQ